MDWIRIIVPILAKHGDHTKYKFFFRYSAIEENLAIWHQIDPTSPLRTYLQKLTKKPNHHRKILTFLGIEN